MSDDRLPVIAALLFGVAFVFITPPFRVPDETLHFFRSDAIATGHVVPNGGSRPDSAHIPQGLKTFVWVMSWVDANGKFTRSQLRTAYAIPLEPIKEPLVEFPAWYTPMPYVPQAIAVAIGRLLNVRPFIIFYGGRLANLLVSILLLALSMRFAAGFRTVIAAVALLPMTLFEFASWSADAVTIAASLLFITLLLRGSVAAGSAVGFIAGLCKPAYFLTALLARRRAIVPVLISIGAATFIAFAYANRAAYQQRRDLPIDPASQLRCIVHQPVHFAGVMARDLVHHGWDYVEGTVAHVGGFGEIALPRVMTWLELLLLIAVGISSGFTLGRSTRLLMLAIFIATAAGVMLSQYLVWSVICGDVIEGVQGRYFLPVLPLLLLSFRAPSVRRTVPMWAIVACAALANSLAIVLLLQRYWW